MFDLMLLFIQLPGSEKIVDSLIILRDLNQQWHPKIRRSAYNLQELAFHLVLPPFLHHHLCNLEHLFHSARDHALGGFRNSTFHSERFTRPSLTICENADIVSINTTLSELRDVFEYFRLSRTGLEDLDGFREQCGF